MLTDNGGGEGFAVLVVADLEPEQIHLLGGPGDPLMDKDLAAAQKLAADLEVELPLVEVTRRNAQRTLGITAEDA